MVTEHGTHVIYIPCSSQADGKVHVKSMRRRECTVTLGSSHLTTSWNSQTGNMSHVHCETVPWLWTQKHVSNQVSFCHVYSCLSPQIENLSVKGSLRIKFHWEWITPSFSLPSPQYLSPDSGTVIVWTSAFSVRLEGRDLDDLLLYLCNSLPRSLAVMDAPLMFPELKFQ